MRGRVDFPRGKIAAPAFIATLFGRSAEPQPATAAASLFTLARLCYNRESTFSSQAYRDPDSKFHADPPSRSGRLDSRRQSALAGVALQGDVRGDLSLQLPLRDVQHLAEEERERDDAGRGRAVLRPLVAVPLGAPHGRRALHAPRSRRSG